MYTCSAAQPAPRRLGLIKVSILLTELTLALGPSAERWAKESAQNNTSLDTTVLEKFHPKPPMAVFLTVFGYNFGPEVDVDVISDVAVEYVGMDVRVKVVILC